MEISTAASLEGTALVQGIGIGAILSSTVPLSFWGGVDPKTGLVIDQHHPLSGQSLSGKVVVIPCGRGSCSGSGVLLEMLLNGNAPSALIFEQEEHILLLAVIIAEEIFGKSIPVLQVTSADFERLSKEKWASISGKQISLGSEVEAPKFSTSPAPKGVNFHNSKTIDTFKLSDPDTNFLSGKYGRAAQAAFRVVLRMAVIQGATELIDVTQGHIDGCVYTGNACLLFAEQLCSWGAKVCVPTTMNSLSVDQRRWRAQGLDPALGIPASQLGDAYVRMGCKPTFTCAPYLLASAPKQGEQIVWAESNAVVYANSVLGAKTMKYPDFMDICVALTGRAPNAGCHVESNRVARIIIDVEPLQSTDDAFFPLLGYMVGTLAGHQIPLVYGLDALGVEISNDDLKAFGAAFATTSSAPMFHIAGITPEASTPEDLTFQEASAMKRLSISREDLLETWKELNSSASVQIDLISLGNPHFSHDEFLRLAQLCEGRVKSKNVAVIVTCGRDIYQKVYNDGTLDKLEDFGVQVITDTCWCMIVDPVIPSHAKYIMTNSGKYAHYGPGLNGRKMRFGGLKVCIDAACSGQAPYVPPSGLQL